MKKENGITLIALVISIIVTIILASVTINTLINNGIINKAKTATQEYKNAQDYEETQIAKYINELESHVDVSRDTVTISKNDYEELKQKGSWELLAQTTSKTGETFNNINDLSQYSNIGLLFKEDNNIIESSICPLNVFIESSQFIITCYNVTSLCYSSYISNTSVSLKTKVDGTAYLYGIK